MRKIIGYTSFVVVCILSVLAAAGYVSLTGGESILFVLCMAAVTAIAIYFLINERTNIH